MTRFILRRLLILPIALLAINFVAFSYALLAQRVQQAQNPFGSSVDASVPILSLYRVYLGNVLTGNWGQMPLVGSSAGRRRAGGWAAVRGQWWHVVCDRG